MRKHILSQLCLLLLPIIISAQPKQYLDSLMNIMRTQNDTSRVLTINKVISFYGNQGLFDSANMYSNQMMELSEKIGYERGKCIANNTYGIPLMVNGKYPKALEYFFKSLAIAEKNNLYQDMMVANRNIAAVFILQDEYKLAIPLLKKVLDRVTLLKDSIKIFPVLTDIGFCYDGLKNKDSAHFYYEAGILLCNRLSSRHMPADAAGMYYQAKARVFEKTAKYYMDNGRDREALSLLLSIWEEIKESPDAYTKIATLNSISSGYQRLGRTDSVLFFSNVLIDLKEAREYPDGLKDAYLYRADALYRTGRYKEAYEDQALSAILKDSVFNNEKYKAIHELQTKYETEKKDEQITGLARQKRTQRYFIFTAIAGLSIALALLVFALRSKRLQRKLHVRDKEIQRKEIEQKMTELEQTALRAQMNPHFIFNCLNSVQRYVINNDVKGVNSYLSTFASLIRQTLENSGKQLISLKDELQYLETYISVEKMRGGNNFEYEISVGDDIDTSDIYLPGMIIQPFVENSILHGMGDKSEKTGKLKLTVVKQEKMIFVVEDNGPGIKKQDQLKTITGSSHESMGGSITARRIEMYNNLHEEKIEFSITDKANAGADGPGTKVRLAFPIIYN